MSSMTPATTFKDLQIWRKSHAVVLKVYALTATFPKSELFGLTSQMRRAAVSVPANIAEGFKRRGRMDKARFLGIAAGSLEELRYYGLLAADLNLTQGDALAVDLDEVSRMLSSYERTILASARAAQPRAGERL